MTNKTMPFIKNTFPIYIISIFLVSVIIFFDTWKSLYDIWMRSETYTHGLFVIPASLWLIWQNKPLHRYLYPTKPSFYGLCFILLNGLFWLLSSMAKIIVFQQFALVGILIGSYWFYLGNPTTKKIMFPLVFLYFMVPAGEQQLLPYMMEYTADFTISLLRFTGITVYREGLHFSLTSGNWSVVEACSGLRYLIASVTLGTIYAYITYRRTYKRIIFIALAIIIPIIANGLRAYMIVMIGHLSNMELATGVDHLVYGAVFFAFIIFIMFYIGSFWQDAEETATQNTVTFKQDENTYTQKTTGIVMLTLLLVMSLWPFTNKSIESRYHAQTTLLEQSVITQNRQWQTAETPHWNWQPKFNGVASESLHYFKKQDSIIGLYQANFGNENQDGELINMSNTLISSEDRKKGHIIKQSNLTLFPSKAGESITLDLSELKINTSSIMAATWYQLGHRQSNNKYWAKIYQLYKRLTLNTSPEIYYVIFTDRQVSQENRALPLIQEFSKHLFLLNQKSN